MPLLPIPAGSDPSTPTVAPLGIEVGTPYTLIGPDGTVAVLNDANDANCVGWITEISGLDSAEVREAVDTRSAADGAVHSTFYLGRRIVVLSGIIAEATTTTGSTNAEQNASILQKRNKNISRLQRATHALGSDLLLRWQTTGGSPVELAMRRNDPLRITERVPKRFQVGLAAADPRIYSQAYNGLSVGGGAATSRKQNTGLVASTRTRSGWDAQLIIQTLGTATTPPLISITGPANAWEVYNATTNTSIIAASGSTSNIPAGSTLTIDYSNATAILQTGSTQTNWYSRIDFATSSWTPLAAGTNDIRLFATGTTTANTAYRVDWRDAWF
jgi:hypothetical protein